MGNVPISCCRSKSPRLDSEYRNDVSNAKFSSSYDSRKLSSKPGPGSSTSSMHQSAQNILQHISEREPDDTETDPSSNPLNRPIFAQRSSHSRTQQGRLTNTSNTQLTSSQDHGYNSGASTNLTYQESSHLTSSSFDSSFQQPDFFETSQASVDSNKVTSEASNQANSRPQSSCLKASSCSTIFIDNSTISQPNLDQTIKCVSLAIYYHIKSRSSDAAADIFDENLHPLRMPSSPQELVMSNSPQQQQQSPIPLFKPAPGQYQSPELHKNEPAILETDDRTSEPNQETIYNFVRTLFRAAQLTSEYAITTLVYLERLMTYAEMDLTPRTWRRMFLGAILLSSKVWEDQAIWNVDYAQILEEISVDDINELERQFLELIQFNMNVPSSVYAKYYFHLRTLAIQNGLMCDQTLLTTGQAKDLEAMSKVYTTDDWFSSPIHRKSPPAIKKHTSLEKLRSSGNAKAVLM